MVAMVAACAGERLSVGYGANMNEWSDVGPNLGGVVAEALCAYEVWRAASSDSDVIWVSGHGHDVEVRGPDGRAVRINAKRAWRRGAPPDFLDCSPLSNLVKHPPGERDERPALP